MSTLPPELAGLDRFRVLRKLGGGAAEVTDFPESGLFIEDPRLSPDGKQLICSRGKITGDLWLLKFGAGPTK